MKVLTDFEKSLLATHDKNEISEKLEWFFNFYQVINYTLHYDRAIWRARICDSPSGFTNLSELSQPPKNLTKAGRLNEPNSPIFYASFSQFTAFEEVGAKEGDYVHLSGYQIKENGIRGCIVGEILKVHRSGTTYQPSGPAAELNKILNSMDFDAALSYVYMDALLSSILRDIKASETNYLHSRELGKRLLVSATDLDAIFYPSVALEDALNIALKISSIPKTIDMMGNSVVRVNKKHKHGLCEFQVIKNSSGYRENGDIVWD